MSITLAFYIARFQEEMSFDVKFPVDLGSYTVSNSFSSVEKLIA
jgi:hypothetical protein